MIEVKQVTTRKQRKEFLDFPVRLYKGNPYFVPPLYLDEKKIFRKDYLYHDTCEDVFYLAYKDGKVAGRISGILQKAANEKNAQKRVRFIRFDCIDDFEVAKELFAAVENWARSLGMEEVVGPLGYSDLEREGLLIEGFDELSTFEEWYNAPYYQDFIERLGYKTEVEWNESQLRYPKEGAEEVHKLADFILKRYKLHLGPSRNANDFIRKYIDQVFRVLDDSYENVYGTVPFTPAMKKLMIDNFRMIVSPKRTAVILDENDKAVAFAITFSSIAKAVQKGNGHITLRNLIPLLRAIRHPKVVDLCLIGVEPEWLNRGVSTVFISHLMDMLENDGVEHFETNLNLLDNYTIQNMWRRFDRRINKRRRAYVKSL